MSSVPHDFAVKRRTGSRYRDRYSQGFTHGVLITLAGIALVAWLICEGGAS